MTLTEAQELLALADDAHNTAEVLARRTDQLEDAATAAWNAQPRYGHSGYDLTTYNAVLAAYKAAQVANDAAQRHARKLNYEAIDAAKNVRTIRINSRQEITNDKPDQT